MILCNQNCTRSYGFILTFCSYSFQMDEFRYKMGSVLPKISKDKQSSRTEFEGLNELMEYLGTQKKTE